MCLIAHLNNLNKKVKAPSRLNDLLTDLESTIWDQQSPRVDYLALIEESLVILSLTGGTRVWLAQGNELTDVPVLISL